MKNSKENDGWICPVWVCETEETQNNGESMHKKKESKPKSKIAKVMSEFKHGDLHSGSKKGLVVSSPAQAKAIALSEARKAGAKIPRKK